MDETLAVPGSAELLAQEIQIGRAGTPVFRRGFEDPTQRFAQQDSLRQDGFRLAPVRLAKAAKFAGFGYARSPCEPAPFE
jgi:hypothetical protein